MIQKILKLKESNSIWFYILIPVLVIAVAIRFFLGANTEAAKKEIKKTAAEDDILANIQRQHRDGADKALDEAREALKAIDETKVEEDWHNE